MFYSSYFNNSNLSSFEISPSLIWKRKMSLLFTTFIASSLKVMFESLNSRKFFFWPFKSGGGQPGAHQDLLNGLWVLGWHRLKHWGVGKSHSCFIFWPTKLSLFKTLANWTIKAQLWKRLATRNLNVSIQIWVRQTQDVVDATSTRPSDNFAFPTSPISGLDVEAEPRPLFNDEAAERNRAIQVLWLINWLVNKFLILRQISAIRYHELRLTVLSRQSLGLNGETSERNRAFQVFSLITWWIDQLIDRLIDYLWTNCFYC